MTAGDGVRQEIAYKDRRRRDLVESLFARFPRGLAARASRLVLRRPPDSWLRRHLLALNLQRVFAAVNRGDFELQALFYDDDVELVVPASIASLIGGQRRFHGAEELI